MRVYLYGGVVTKTEMQQKNKVSYKKLIIKNSVFYLLKYIYTGECESMPS